LQKLVRKYPLSSQNRKWMAEVCS